MSSLEMHWSVGVNEEKFGGSNRDPTLSDVTTLLPAMLSSTGNITMYVHDADPLGPQILETEIEDGCIVFLLLQGANNENYVRFYSRSRNEYDNVEMVEVRGQLWMSSVICTDLNVAYAVFKSFIDDGDVSRNILN